MSLPSPPSGDAPRGLTAVEFQGLRDMPPEAEWFANLGSIATRRAYQADLRDFMTFAGISRPEAFRDITRAHVLAWRKDLEARGLAGATIRRKLAALGSLYAYLCERHAVATSPVAGVRRPRSDSHEGKTPALGDAQARTLLDTPDPATLKGLRDRAIVAVLLHHGLRRAELCALRVQDMQPRRGIAHLRVHGKGGKIRHLPLHPAAADRIHAYLERAGHGASPAAPLFQALRGARRPDRGLSGDGVRRIVASHAIAARIEVLGLGVHGLRATAATNALEHGADIAQVQDWLGHASVATTRKYDRRGRRPEDSPTFKVRY
ncbi:tyrosine-type recombinase/integrase [Cupriavidus necator]|uniref:tyrosine-type recombinase/integrase n=1 Tax=Cupriavidus necator TaxID=106590 RepID=UPI003ECC2B22